MTQPYNIPDWAFKALFASLIVLSPFIIYGFTLLYNMSNDIAVMKDRTENIDYIEKKVSDHESRINLVEDKLHINKYKGSIYGTER